MARKLSRSLVGLTLLLQAGSVLRSELSRRAGAQHHMPKVAARLKFVLLPSGTEIQTPCRLSLALELWMEKLEADEC